MLIIGQAIYCQKKEINLNMIRIYFHVLIMKVIIHILVSDFCF